MNAREIYDPNSTERTDRIAAMLLNEARRALPGRPESSVKAAARLYARNAVARLERQS